MRRIDTFDTYATAFFGEIEWGRVLALVESLSCRSFTYTRVTAVDARFNRPVMVKLMWTGEFTECMYAAEMLDGGELLCMMRPTYSLELGSLTRVYPEDMDDGTACCSIRRYAHRALFPRAHGACIGAEQMQPCEPVWHAHNRMEYFGTNEGRPMKSSQ